MSDIASAHGQAELTVKLATELLVKQGHTAADALLFLVYAAGLEAEARGIDLQAADADLRARLDQAGAEARCLAVRHAQRLLEAEDQGRQGGDPLQ